MRSDETLLNVLLSAARDAPDQQIVQVDSEGGEDVQTYSELLDDSLLVAGGFRAADVPVGSPVILLPGRSDEFLPAFWGALAAGLVPVPLAPVPERVLAVWAALNQPPVVVTDALEPLVRQCFVEAGSPGRLDLLTLSRLRAGPPVTDPHHAVPADLAFLQFSSGSTSAPKGVELTHANVLANIVQTRTAGAATATDVIVSWLPYFHDMGLIGAHLAPLSVRIKQVKLEPHDFAKRPALWYETAASHRATLLPMASFALSLTLRRVSSEEIAGWDLSCVRLLGVGAEPIPVRAWRQFLDHLRPARLDPRALVPLYGLAEATVAVTFPPLGERAEPLVLDRHQLSRGRAVDAHPDDAAEDVAEFLDVGRPVPGGELRIVADDGAVLADHGIGNIEFRGPNVARGYHALPEETANTFGGGWLRTGDLGFLRDGRLCVTGRAKDVLFIHGQKYHAHDVEQLVAATPGLPPGRVAVVGSADPATGAERVAVFVTSPTAGADGMAEAVTAVRARVREALAYDDVHVVPIPSHEFPRTTSGKLQRARLRELLAAGAFALQDVAAPSVRATGEARGLVRPPASRVAVEAQITHIWSEVLGVPAATIGRDDRFLAIGGSSLAAMHVLGRLEEKFGGPLEPAVLRDCATVAALAGHVLVGQNAPAAQPPLAESAQRSDGAAVIGLACRFPDAHTPDAFWSNLAAGRDSVTSVPTSRWTSPPGTRARWGAFLDDVAGFDAGFFGVEPHEAEVMDPHARIFLEVAHEALERAGYAGVRRQGRRVGVFVAVGESGYGPLLHRVVDSGGVISPAALVGNLRNLIAARVAHCLDLSGPALAVDTACSSSLMALHLARRSLDAGECDVAVVGGVSLNLTATSYQLLEAAKALSPTGRCRAFSSGADGFVPGEGAAALVLEPLAAARAAGDPVLAVVRGSAVNNDGRSLSLMAPNPLLQEAVIADAYRDAAIDPATVSYIEAHGTGTAIGDPIEARSLIRTFPPGDTPRWVGSVKTNVGHLLNAAGMPSLLKVVLALHHRQLPATLHYTEPSPEFDLASAGLEVVTQLRDWTAAGPLRAGINGFGFGGTNVHVILEEAPSVGRPADVSSHPGPHLLTVSAASPEALRAAVVDLAVHVRTHREADVGDLCHSVATARDDGRHRLALVAGSDLADQLESRQRFAVAPARPRLALLFTGQGSQVPGMGRALHDAQPVYRQTITGLSDSVGPIEGRSLVEWSLDADADPAALAQTAVAQPLLVAFGIAVAAQLGDWAVTADAVLGHSVGELAAAAVSGALSPQDAVDLAAERGRLMQHLCPPGAMAAVIGEEAEIRSVLAALSADLSVAAANGPHLVISGSCTAIDEAVSALGEQGLRARRLPVSRAFHSPLMTPALDGLRAAADGLMPRSQQIPLLSSVTCAWTPTFDAPYLARHAIESVRFGPCVQRLLDEGYDTFLEVGPDATLTGLVRSTARSRADRPDIDAFSVTDPRVRDGAAPTRAVARLWERGVPIRRPARPGRPRVEVPTYPFQRRRYWLPDVVDRVAAGTAPNPPISSVLHRFGWEETPLPAGSVLGGVHMAGRACGIAKSLADRLTRRGVSVHRAGTERPASSVVIAFAGPSVDIDAVEPLDVLARENTTALLHIARQLEDVAPLIVVTEDATLTGNDPERVRAGQAILAGLAKALSEESPQQGVRIVDLSSLDDEATRTDSLIRELDAPPAPGPAESVAWRNGRRLAQVPLLDEVLEPDRPATLRPDGSYLITGGAGGIGAEVARALARRGRAALVLVGRSPTCPPSLIGELRSLGAEVHYVAADISVEADVDALVDALPPLDGVFHAAGVVRPGWLRSATVAQVEEVLAPKVRGTYLLARALDRTGRRPETFVALSSIASAMPGYAGGLGAYTAANSFLDAFVLAENAAGRRMQALNFAAWSDTGMADSAAFRFAAATNGAPHLSVEQALEALFDATRRSDPQLLVLDTTPARALPEAPDEAVPGPARTDSHTAESPVRELITTLVAARLGQPAEHVDQDSSFLVMGLDSLTAVDLVKELEQALGRALPTTLLFEYSSIRTLSEHLASTPAREQRTEVAQPHGVGPFPLTPVQVAFHTTGRLHPGLAAYAYLRQSVTGGVDEHLLAGALAVLERRHPLLRLRIQRGPGEPRQVIGPPTGADRPGWFEAQDLDGPIDVVEEELCNRVFDLANEPPIRVLLVRQGGERASLLICVHHAAADGASLNLLCEELWLVYTAMHLGRAPELAELGTDFRDHVDLVEKLRASEEFADDCRYWRGRLDAGRPPGRLPCDGDAGAPRGPLTARQFATTASQTAALHARAAGLGVSLFHLVLSTYVRRLASWSGQRDVTVNVARAGREARLADIARVVGPFADTLPLTVTVPDTGDPQTLAHEVRAAWLESEQHARVTSLDLARLLPTRGTAPRTVADASFSFARFPVTTPPGCPVEVSATAARTASAATRLSLVCWEFDGALQFSWNYPAHLFRADTIERLTDELLTELDSMAGPAAAPAGEPSLTERIRAQCRRTPTAVAVDAGGERLTYGELDASADRAAAELGRLGIRRGDGVVLLTPPGPHTVVGLLGILRAGAAWVPLDAAHPWQRLADQAALAGVAAVVCDDSTRQVADRLGAPGIVDLDAPPAGADVTGNADPVPDPHDVAYVIFTSGTTGRPKGVPITHLGLTTYLDWAVSTFGYDASDRMIATASICFDASVRQLLAPLLVGATIVTVSQDVLRDPPALLATLEDRRVSVWSSVPTLWEHLLRAAERAPAPPDLSALRWVHVGGEALSPALVRRWFDLFGREQRVVNLYGPTEATINATFEVIDSRPDDDLTRMPIGRPVARTVVDVVGPDGQSCSPGEAGELLVAGPGVTPGYLGEPGSYDDAFVHRGGMRYYRTGDRVVLRSDDRLEFLGRMDRQVSIRGHRVEPDEVDAVLQSHPDVERVVTVPVESPAGTRLVSFVHPRAEPAVRDAEELRCYLADRLPDYLVPAQIRLVDSLPLTAAGKVDTAALAAAAAPGLRSETSRDGTPAVTATERLIATVWSDLLGVEPVFREDDFFVLGGDSIAVLEVFSRLEPHRPNLPPPTALYRHRTLSGLAAAVDAVASETPAGTHHPAAAGPFPLTPSQRGFLLAEALAPGARSSWVASFRLTGRVDQLLLQQAVDALVERHLMLRVRFATDQRPPVQAEVPGPARLPVQCESIRPEELDKRIREERGHRFETSSWPLVRLRLLRLGTDAHALIVHAHHLVGDGYSVVVLGQDLMRIYDRLAAGQSAELPPLRSTFRDYADLLQRTADGSASGPVEPYGAPVLRAPGESDGGECLTERLIVDRGTASALRTAAASERATPYAPLLTAYYRALARLTGHADLVLGVTVTGRDHALPDIARMVGPLATILPVRVRAGGLPARAQLRHVACAVTAARAAGASMQRLADTSAGPTRGLPSFGAQFLFSHLDFDALGPMSGETVSLTWDETTTELEPPPIGTDLLLTVRPSHGRLHVTVRSAAGVMDQQRLRGFAATLRAELAQVAGSSHGGSRSGGGRRDVLDAALVGYLPAPSDLAALAGLPASDGLRERIRTAVFPDGQARLLEELSTPLGRSGFVCLPMFADELSASSGDALADDCARAIGLAGDLGARCVSLAGLVPARTAYGFTVVRALGPVGPRVSTGHAATAASVVKTTIAAMSAARRALEESTLACVGLGSIGRSSLELLLAVAAGSPQRLILCDVGSRSRQLAELAAQLTSRGFAGDITLCASDASLPATAYEADLVIGASSAVEPILDIGRLRPGTIVVDDSFPHCFDAGAAIDRMQRQGDVLVVGGGLLHCGHAVRAAADDVTTLADASRWLRLRPEGTVASCQLESLLQADRPELPVVHGLVDIGHAASYWQALADVDVEAAPLHLREHLVTMGYLDAFSQV